MTDGLILLGFLALLFAVGIARVRGRLGIRTSGRAFATMVAGFAIIALILWATNGRRA